MKTTLKKGISIIGVITGFVGIALYLIYTPAFLSWADDTGFWAGLILLALGLGVLYAVLALPIMLFKYIRGTL